MKLKIFFIPIICFALGTQAQTLQDYLQLAEQNNPQLKAALLASQSSFEKIDEAGSLANTTIGVGYFLQEAETRVGAQKTKLSVTQMLPWFGTLNAKKESAKFMAKATHNSVEITRRNLLLKVKQNYFELYEIQKHREILSENLTTLQFIKKLAVSALENNKTTLVDVLKINVEENELQNILQTKTEQLHAKKISFNLLLNREIESPISIANSLLLDDIIVENSRLLLHNNPNLNKMENEKQALEQLEIAAQKESLPAIGLGLDYVIVENRPVLNLDQNGKDIIMPMFSISVPLFSKKYVSKQKQLKLEQQAIEASQQEMYNNLQTNFEQALSNLKNAKMALETHNKNIIEVENAAAVLLTAYENGKTDFSQMLEIQQLKRNFQLKKITSEKEYAIQKAILDYLTSSF
jgi:outer membrane protein TolC